MMSLPVGVLAEAKEPWQKIDWSPEIEQGIYKDWGVFYSNRRRENTAMRYYNQALELLPTDYITLYHRALTKLKTAQTEGALLDSQAAAELATQITGAANAPINLETCNALYELNQFENCKVELHKNTRQFTGNKIKAFDRRLIVVDENIKDALGESLGPFILENERVIHHVMDLIKSQKFIDSRPLWKILKEQDKCDVLSILEAEEELLSPLEIARRKRALDVFIQSYLNKSWIDVIFLKHLRQNPNLLLSQSPTTTDFFSKLTARQYEMLKNFLKMLQARTPMYYVRRNKFPNKKMFEKHREDSLFRIQYQTRRNMISVLRSIRKLRADKNLKKLTEYVEEIMGDYVVLKTNKIMPWKFEFLNEVYNTLGLAYVEQYQVPSEFNFSDKIGLLKLLKLPTDKSIDFVPFVFGDRSTHNQPDAIDPTQLKDRKLISRLDRRMLFAKYAIERSYLLHQIAQTHLDQNRYDECCFSARKAIEEAKKCNSNIWRFLSVLLIVKSHSSLHKVERAKEALESALEVAHILKCPPLTNFIETCIICNVEEILKKQSMSANASRRQSKSSYPSSTRSSFQMR